MNPNFREINAKEQEERPDSVLSFYKELIRLRKSEIYGETVVYGETKPLLTDEKNIMAYLRLGESCDLLVIGNFDCRERRVQVEELKEDARVRLLLNNCGQFCLAHGTLRLSPCQALVFALEH